MRGSFRGGILSSALQPRLLEYYLTDELVWVDASGTRLRGFARPLHLKTEAGALFAGLFAPPENNAVAETAHGHHVSPLRLSP